ncbi:MAG TPA: aspartate/glutamate racemase family protein [Burkholderiales bacterium]|nr:aspartate/glutamate racemase family protein [Burkholderiales bacterium]
MRIWHQSFTVLEQLPAYAARLQEHFTKVARPDTEVVMHGMHAKTYRTNYPGTDIKHNYMQYLHGQQFVLGGIAAEEAGFDAYAIMSIPEPALRETRSIIDIPVVGYGESSMLVARMLGERMGALIFIEGMTPIIEENAKRVGLESKFAGARFVGFTFNDVLQAYEEPLSLLERFHTAARAMIAEGVDVIIPGEAPLCALLMKHGVTRVDDVPIVDALGATIKMAEAMVDLKRSSGLAPARRGYFTEKPPRERVKELIELYGMNPLRPKT